MSDEADWGDLESLPQQKRVVPIWLWGCGIGCLLFVLLLGSGAFFAVDWFKQGLDPERIEEQLGAAIPFDSLPEGFDPVFGRELPFLEMGFYVLRTEEESRVAVFFQFPDSEDGRKAAIEMFEGESGRADPLEIEVQGRVLRAAHVDDEMNNAFAGSDIDVEGQGVLVELTQEGGRPLLLIYSTKEHPEEVPLEEVVEFLEPFHVGPGR